MATEFTIRRDEALQAMARLLQQKAAAICQGWERFAPRKSLAGLTLSQFRETVAGACHQASSIHHYAELAELIFAALRAIESDTEGGREGAFYQAVHEAQPTPDDGLMVPLAA